MPTTIVNAQNGAVVALSAALASPSTFRTIEQRTGASLLLSDFIAQPSTLLMLDVSTGRQVTYAQSGAATLRLEPSSSDSFFLVQRSGTGATVINFQRGTGAAADASNAGPPYLKFRPFKLGTLTDYTLPVTGNVTWQTDELGGMDYVAGNASNKFFGSFHGDGPNGVLHSESILIDGVAADPTVAKTGGTFAMRSDVTSSDGTTSMRADMSYTAVAGGLTIGMNTLSWTGITKGYFGMPTATGTGMTEQFPAYNGVEVLGALLFLSGQEGVAYWGPATGMRSRNPTTGGYVGASGNMVGRAGFVEARTDKELGTSRSKTYLSQFNAVDGLPGSVVTFNWGTSTPGASTPIANMLDTSLAAPPYTHLQSNGTVVVAGGDATLTYSGPSNSDTRVHIASGTQTGFRGFCSLDLVSATGTGTRTLYMSANVNASNTTPTPAVTTATYQSLMPIGRTIMYFVGNADSPNQRWAYRHAAASAATSVIRNPFLGSAG